MCMIVSVSRYQLGQNEDYINKLHKHHVSMRLFTLLLTQIDIWCMFFSIF